MDHLVVQKLTIPCAVPTRFEPRALDGLSGDIDATFYFPFVCPEGSGESYTKLTSLNCQTLAPGSHEHVLHKLPTVKGDV